MLYSFFRLTLAAACLSLAYALGFAPWPWAGVVALCVVGAVLAFHAHYLPEAKKSVADVLEIARTLPPIQADPLVYSLQTVSKRLSRARLGWFVLVGAIPVAMASIVASLKSPAEPFDTVLLRITGVLVGLYLPDAITAWRTIQRTEELRPLIRARLDEMTRRDREIAAISNTLASRRSAVAR